MRAGLVAVMIGLLALPAEGQTARPATPGSQISGRVLDDQTDDPIPNVRLTVGGVALGAPVVLTDAGGRFSLPVPSGRLTIVANKSGWAPGEITLTTPAKPIEIRLRRGAAIVGRVVDEFGEPVLAARVTAEVLSRPQGNTTVAATTDTDDRGEFRLASLPAGAFVVAVLALGATAAQEIRPGVFGVFPANNKTYFPGVAAAADAQEVQARFGEVRSGIDFVIPASRSGNQPYSVVRAIPGPPLVKPAQQVSAARGTGSIRGRVVDTNGRGLAYAFALMASQKDVFFNARVVRTDADGQFEFQELPPGSFSVVASKAGYFPLASGDLTAASARTSGVAIELPAGETRDRVVVTLVPWGTLSGRVLDEYGDPLQGASVQLLQVRYEAGRRRLVPAGAARLTDDLGQYRLYGLRPGQYIVSAAIGDASSPNVPGYTRSYYPSTPTPSEALFVSIGPGQNASSIEVVLSRTRTARIAGRMLNAAGEETTGGTVMLMPSQRSTSVTSVPVGARLLPNGSFEFSNVPPDQYVIQAYRGRSNGWTEGEFGALPVSVADADVTDLVLQMSAGSSITGRISLDSAADPKNQPAASSIELSPIPVDYDLSPPNNFASADIHPDWTFAIAGISGPRRLQVLRTPAGWALKEIVVNGLDVTDRPLVFGRADQSLSNVEVVLTDRVSELIGTIRDDNGRLSPRSHAIVFSSDSGRWYSASRFLRATTSAADGAFAIQGLPFGSYYVAAVDQLPPYGDDAWQEAAFLDSLISRASTVTVREGERVAISLRVFQPASR